MLKSEFESRVKMEVIIDTEKTTIEEAYHVAVANGADPRKLIEYTTND